ncbi:hypothetical protein [Spirillospora sp. NPDC048819]|uniref:hypothetical protein n=1 Tax=Spirillospora sp. NPDC048819 TaxID=3155268 RepID=UPI0033FB8390
MIIIPRVLNKLLHEVDESHARTLALRFAEQSLLGAQSILDPALAKVSLSYIAAARDFMKSGDIAGLQIAHDQYFKAREGVDDVSAAVSWVACIAVMAACQRNMEQAGIVVRESFIPSVFDVAHEAQKVAGRKDLKDPRGPQVARRARWEQARRQLVLLIESAPFPE